MQDVKKGEVSKKRGPVSASPQNNCWQHFFRIGCQAQWRSMVNRSLQARTTTSLCTEDHGAPHLELSFSLNSSVLFLCVFLRRPIQGICTRASLLISEKVYAKFLCKLISCQYYCGSTTDSCLLLTNWEVCGAPPSVVPKEVPWN